MLRRIALLREACRLRHVLAGVLPAGLVLLTALAAQVQESGTVRFAAFGDFGKAGAGELEVATLVKSWNPDFITVLGDNNYERGEASTIDANIGQYYREFISPYVGTYGTGGTENRFFPALGNHDWGDGFVQPPNIQAHLDYFDLPGNERYYDVERGPVHLFVVDSDFHEPDGILADSLQAEWLRASLAASTSPWKIVVFHHPPYSSAPRPQETYMRWPFREWGATAVLAGHHHHYESLLLDNMPYFISGLGGNGAADLSFPVPGSRVRYRSTLGALRVTASDQRLLFEFVATSGAVVDSYAIDAPAAPGAAHNLVATGVPTGRIDLWWSDAASDETGFIVERSDDGVNFAELATLGPNVTNYTDLTVNPTPTSYRYRVLAQVPGEQAYSNVALGTTVPPPPDAPAVAATPLNTTSVRLTWSDVVGDTGYNVYRKVQGVYNAIGSVNAATLQFTDTERIPATTYTYVVRAVNAGGESVSSSETSVTLGRLSTPTGLTATALSSRDIALAWTDTSTGENNFKVMRSADGVAFSIVAWVPANATSYVDGGRQPATTYWYRVQAYEAGGGLSEFSNKASATTMATGTAPAPASGLTATTYQYRVVAYTSNGAQSSPSNVVTVTTPALPTAPNSLTATANSSTQITLTWADRSSDETHFKVDRSTNGSSYGTVAWVTANLTSYVDKGRTAGTTYHYKVSSYNNNGTSAPSNTASVTTP